MFLIQKGDKGIDTKDNACRLWAALGSINEVAIPVKMSNGLPVNKYCWESGIAKNYELIKKSAKKIPSIILRILAE